MFDGFWLIDRFEYIYIFMLCRTKCIETVNYRVRGKWWERQNNNNNNNSKNNKNNSVKEQQHQQLKCNTDRKNWQKKINGADFSCVSVYECYFVHRFFASFICRFIHFCFLFRFLAIFFVLSVFSFYLNYFVHWHKQ